MAATLEDRVDEIEEQFNKDIAELRQMIRTGDQRIERFINGEKDLGAKGILDRMIKMEEVFRQYEGLGKIFEWIEKLIKWGFWAAPFVGAALLWAHHNLGKTNQIFNK